MKPHFNQHILMTQIKLSTLQSLQYPTTKLFKHTNHHFPMRNNSSS